MININILIIFFLIVIISYILCSSNEHFSNRRVSGNTGHSRGRYNGGHYRRNHYYGNRNHYYGNRGYYGNNYGYPWYWYDNFLPWSWYNYYYYYDPEYDLVDVLY